MHMSSDNLLLAERKAVYKPATIDITMRREETNAGTTQMTALVKGSRAKLWQTICFKWELTSGVSIVLHWR